MLLYLKKEATSALAEPEGGKPEYLELNPHTGFNSKVRTNNKLNPDIKHLLLTIVTLVRAKCSQCCAIPAA